MVHRKSLLLLLSAVFLLPCCRPAGPPFECTDAIGCVTVGPDDPIEISVLQVLSGELGPVGLTNLRSIVLALDDRGGEILGHRVELQSHDSLCSKEGGATTAARIVANPQIVGIIGPTCSGAAAAAMKMVSEAGLVMVSGSSTAHTLTSAGGKPGADWRPGFLRTAQNDAQSGRVAAAFAFQELGVTRAATIDDGDTYTRGFARVFEEAFAELGGEVVLVAGVNKGDTNMRPVLTAVARSGAVMVFFPVYQPEGDHIVLQAREMKELEDVTLMGAEGLYRDTFLTAIGDAGTGLYLVIPTPPKGLAHDLFVSRYVAKYGGVPTPLYYAHTYDAANILLNAVEKVAISESNGTLHIGRQALRDALYATSAYQGLTGTLTCDQYGDCGVARFEVVRLDDPAAGLQGLAANVVYTYP